MSYPPKPSSESLPVRIAEYQHEVNELTKFIKAKGIITNSNTIEVLENSIAVLKQVAMGEQEEIRALRFAMLGKIFILLCEFANENNINLHDTIFFEWLDIKRDNHFEIKDNKGKSYR